MATRKQTAEAAEPAGSESPGASVRATDKTVLAAAGEVGPAVAVQVISQAAAMVVVDAQAYLQNIMTVCVGMNSVAAKMLTEPDQEKQAQALFGEATALVKRAQEEFARAGETSIQVIHAASSMLNDEKVKP